MTSFCRRHKKTSEQSGLCSDMVPEVGLEPTRYCYQRILSPSRLPVPSFRRKGICAPKRMPAAGKRRGACAPAVNIVAHRAVVGKKKLPLRPVLPPALPVHVNFNDRASRVTAACPSPSRPLPCPCAWIVAMCLAGSFPRQRPLTVQQARSRQSAPRLLPQGAGAAEGGKARRRRRALQHLS